MKKVQAQKIIFLLFLLSVVFSFSCNLFNDSVNVPLRIFTGNRIEDITTDENGLDKFTILLSGDTMLGRNIEREAHSSNDYSFPMSNISDLLSKATIAFTNLESPLTSGQTVQKGIVFKADPIFAGELKKAGFNIVSIANNHILDYGITGMQSTIRFLKQSGINSVGADMNSLSHNGIIINRGECKVGFIAFTDTLNSLRKTSFARDKVVDYKNTIKICESVKTLKKNVDVVIVSIHWGVEYSFEPLKEQIQLAEKIIESGGDIIVGHHPHVIQHYRRYRSGHIFFSLGNLVFDQTSKIETRSCVIIGVAIGKKKISSIDVYPVMIDNRYRPAQCGGNDAKNIYTYLLR